MTKDDHPPGGHPMTKDELEARGVRIHCITYRQMAAMKAVLGALGKKLAAKEQAPTEQTVRILAALEEIK